MASKTENRAVTVYINGVEVENNIKKISGAFRKLNAELRNTERGSTEYNRKLQELRKAKAILDSHTQAVRQTGSEWKKVMGQIAGTALGVGGGMFFTGLIERGLQLVPQLIEKNAQLSDSIADIMKTTGRDESFVKQLNNDLKAIDTRTPLNKLRQLAAEAGKAGKTSRDEILDYVNQANIITTALGEDLGEGAVLRINKAAEAFNTTMINIGSAVNELGSNSNAAEAYLVDFLARVQGTGTTANIAAGDLLGYAAVLDEAGLQAEMSSTALNGFFIDFLKNTEKFGAAAGMAQGELTGLVGELGANEAFVTFLRNLKESSGSADVFLRKLEEVNITSDRGSNVFLTLSKNIDKLVDRQKLANNALAEGTSVINEYNVKNTNLAATVEKLQKRLAGLWVNSGLNTFIKEFVNDLERYTRVDVAAKLEEERAGFLGVRTEILRSNTPREKQLELIRSLQERYPDFLGSLKAEQIGYDDLANALDKVNNRLIKKIALAKQEEKIQDTRENLGLLTGEMAEKELELNELLGKLQDDKLIKLNNELDLIAQAQDAYDQLLKTNASKGGLMNGFRELQLSGLIDDYQGLEAMVQAYENGLGNSVEFAKQLEDTLDRMLGLKEFVPGALDGRFMEGGEFGSTQNTTTTTTVVNGGGGTGTAMPSADMNFRMAMRYDEEKVVKGINDALKEQFEYENKIAERVAERESSKVRMQQIDNALKSEEQLQYEEDLAYWDAMLAKAKEMGYRVAEIEKARQDFIDEYLKSQEETFDWDTFLEKAEDYYSQLYDLASSIYDRIDEAAERALEAENERFDKRIENLDRMYDRGLMSEKAYNAQKAKIDKEREKAEEQMERERFERNKRFNLVTIAIDTALNVVKSVKNNGGIPAGIPFGAAAGALGAAQMAVVGAEKYEKGGYFLADGLFHSEGGMPVIDPRTGQKVAEVEKNEAILGKWFTANYPELTQAAVKSSQTQTPIDTWLNSSNINVTGAIQGKRFERGGFVGNSSFSGGPQTSSTTAVNNAEVLAELRQIKNAFANMPTHIKAYVSLTEMNDAQQDLNEWNNFRSLQ